METPSLTAIPTATDVETMLGALPDGMATRAAALHLALPVGVSAQVSVRQGRTSWTYRGITLDWSENIATDAAQLALLGHASGDLYLDPSAEPASWVKVLRSGVHQHTVGADLLFGAPLVALEVGVDPRAGVLLVEQWNQGREPLGVVDLGEVGTYLVEGGATGLLVRTTSGPDLGSRPEGDLDVRGCGTSLAEELGASSWTAEVVGSLGSGLLDVHFHFVVGGLNFLVPVTLGPRSEMVGVPASAYTFGEGKNIGSFQVVGIVSDGDETVLRHLYSGIVGILGQ